MAMEWSHFSISISRPFQWRWTTKHTIDAPLLYNTTTFIARSLQDWLQTTVNWIWLFYQHYRIRGRTCPCQAGTRICLSSRHFSCDVSFLVLFCFLVIQHFSTRTITFHGTAWLLCFALSLSIGVPTRPTRIASFSPLVLSLHFTTMLFVHLAHTHILHSVFLSHSTLSHSRTPCPLFVRCALFA